MSTLTQVAGIPIEWRRDEDPEGFLEWYEEELPGYEIQWPEHTLDTAKMELVEPCRIEGYSGQTMGPCRLVRVRMTDGEGWLLNLQQTLLLCPDGLFQQSLKITMR